MKHSKSGGKNNQEKNKKKCSQILNKQVFNNVNNVNFFQSNVHIFF